MKRKTYQEFAADDDAFLPKEWNIVAETKYYVADGVDDV